MRRRVVAVALCAAVAGLAAPGLASSSTSRPRYAATVFGGAGGEPNVAVSPDGRVVLADGLGSSREPANLYRSTDGGKHFTQVHIDVPQVGGGDWDMHFIGRRTVIAVDLSLGAGIYVNRSDDGGLEWTQTTINGDVYDRPWVAGRGKDVYVVAKGFDAVPYLYQSHDGGRSFSPAPVPLYGTGATPAEVGGTSPTPVEAVVTNQNAYVDNLTVDPRTGDVYVLYGIDSVETYPAHQPLGAPSRLYVAHLEKGPGGQQMVSRPVYLGGADEAFYAGFNWLAVDARGTLYVSANGRHAGHESAWLSYSKNKGRTWSRLVDVGTPKKSSVYGAIAAGRPGTLSLVYLEGSKASANVDQNWYAVMATITGADTSRPRVQRTRALARPIHTKDICLDGLFCGLPGFGENRDLLDYIDNAVGPDGTAHAVVASDGPATEDERGVSVVYLRQVAGPRHGTGVPS